MAAEEKLSDFSKSKHDVTTCHFSWSKSGTFFLISLMSCQKNMTVFLMDQAGLSLESQYFGGYSPLFFLLKSFNRHDSSPHVIKFETQGFSVESSFSLLSELMQRGVSMTETDKNGKTVLMLSIFFLQFPIVQQLLDKVQHSRNF